VIVGPVSEEDIRQRAVHGFTQFAPVGYNEQTLELAGFRLLERVDLTVSLLKNATGRLAARLSHRTELEGVEGSAAFEQQQRYLETVIGLSQSGAVSRMMYLAEIA
jgi:hypothetical protein